MARALLIRALAAMAALTGTAAAEPLAKLALDVDAANDRNGWSSQTMLNLTAPDLAGRQVSVTYRTVTGPGESRAIDARFASPLPSFEHFSLNLDGWVSRTKTETDGALSLRSVGPQVEGWRLSTSLTGAYDGRFAVTREAFRLADARLKLDDSAGANALEFGLTSSGVEARRWDAAFRHRLGAPIAARFSVSAPTEPDRGASDGLSFRLGIERAIGAPP